MCVDRNNRLAGTIPSLSNLASLEVLYLQNNSLTGGLDDLVSTAPPNLRKVMLSSNTLTGTLPDDVGRMASLTELRVESNELSGTVSSGVCGLIASGSLDTLVSDCDAGRDGPRVECSCCTECH